MWDLPNDVPAAPRRSCTAVWFQHRWHALHTERFPGRDVLSVVAERFRTPADLLRLEASLCVFGFSFRGETCSSVAVVHERHEGDSEDNGEWRLICDLRPVGLLPVVVCVPAQGFGLSDLGRRLAIPLDRALRFSLHEIGDASEEGAACLHTILVTASPSETGGALLMPDRYHPRGPLAAISQGSSFFQVGVASGQALFVHRPARQPRLNIASDSETSEHSAQSQGGSVQVLVLAVDWVGKPVEVDLTFPESEQDLFAAVAEELPHSFALLYPHFVAVWPQPSVEWATVLALPGWTVSEDIIILDMRQVDGRLFPTACAPVLMLGSLFEIADLDDDGTWQVTAFGRAVENRDELLHIVRHGCVVFSRVGTPAPHNADLATMLASPFGWNVEASVPLGPGGRRGNFICAVLEAGTRLYRVQPAQDRHHLEDIAETYGLALHWTTAQVVRPAVHNACVKGHRCRGVALISGAFPSVPVPPAPFRPGDFPIALDCRPILQGWQIFLVFDFRCSHAEIAQHYSVLAPPDFHAQIDGVGLDGDRLQVQRGSVLTVSWVPISPDQQLPSESEAAFEPVCEMASPGSPSSVRWHASRSIASGAEASAARSVRSRSPHRTRLAKAFAAICFSQQPLLSATAVVARAPDSETPGAAPHYALEEAQIHARVARGRDPLQRPPPNVLREAPVFLPDPEIVLEWPGLLTDIPFLVFAQECWPQRVTIRGHASILAAIDIAPHTNIIVYVRDSPWALEDGLPCFLEPGDLICVAWRGHPILVATNLTDMLMSAEGWNLQVDLPGHFDSAFWVLANDGPSSFHLAAGERFPLRTRLAEFAQIAADELKVCVAQPRVWDHCFCGVYHRTVIAAVLGCPQHFPPERLLVFLDIRPVLQGFEWVTADHPGFPLEPFVRRFSAHCPPGFLVQVRGGAVVHTDLGAHLAVPDGGVLSVHFVPAAFDSSRSGSGSSTSSVSSGSGGFDSPDADAGSEHDGASPAVSAVGVQTTGGRALHGRRALSRSHAVAIFGFALIGNALFGNRECRGQWSPRPCILSRAEASLGFAGGWSDSSSVADFNVDVGPTLLEESIQACSASATHPFFLACTLLEALWEHSVDRGANFDGFSIETEELSVLDATDPVHVALPAAAPHVIRLDELVAAAPEVPHGTAEHFDLTEGQCLSPCSAEHLQVLQHKIDPRSLGGVPPGVPKPWRFCDWVNEGALGRVPGPGEILILTADGSFCPSTGAAGWAVVLSVAAVGESGPGQFVGCLFGEVCTDVVQEACSAFVAEVTGLLWAGVVAFQHPTFANVVFRADNQAALHGVGGSLQMPDTPLCLAARSLHFSFALLDRNTPTYAHVRGHTGDCANELADGLANLGSAGRRRVLPFVFDVCDWLADKAAKARWLPHVCLSAVRPAALPRMRGGLLSWASKQEPPRLTQHQLMRPFTRALGASSGDTASVSFAFACRCASFNALSLLDPARDEGRGGGLYGAAGRVGLLASSLSACQIYIAGIQETRTPVGSCVQPSYARYCSGCNERRCYGVELWIARGHNWPSHSFTVSHADPCRLIGRLQFAEISINVLVGHGPHRAFADQVKRDWWADTLRLCRSGLHGSDWLILVDGNCRVGSEVSAFVGDYQADVEDAVYTAGYPAHLNNAWKGMAVLTCRRKHAHFNVVTSLAFLEVGGSGKLVPLWTPVQKQGAPKKARRIDPVAIKDPQNADRIRGILRDAPHIDWEANVNDHAAVLVEYLFGELSREFPLEQRRLRKSFLSAEAGTLHAAVARLRHALRNRTAALRLARLRCAFLAWQGCQSFVDLFFGEWASRVQLSISALASRLADAGQALKRLCRRDKRLHVDALADQVQQAPAGEVHVALRRLLRPKRFRRTGHDPLPRLRKVEGGFCTSQAEINQEWRSHFAALEGGRPVSVEELVQFGVQGQAQADPVEVLCFSEVPDLPSLAVHFRSVCPNKAWGPDWIPPALCRLFSFQMAEVFYPVLLKTLAYTAEPVGMKGGTLYRIPKAGTPDQSALTSQRAILVQSVLEKVLHKAVRGITVCEWNKRAPDLMIGGRKGQSYVFGYVCTRAFLEYTRRRSIPSAILFTDISSAYYSVIRELLTGGKLEQANVLEIAASLSLTPEDLQVLQAHVADEPVLCGADSGPLLAALTHELHSGTWFLMNQDVELVHTRRGTRPGSSLADVLYGLLFTRVLQRRGDFSHQGWKPLIPWNGRRDFQPYDGRAAQQTQVEVQDLVYADDLATCIVEDKSSQLPAAVRGVASASIDVLAGHGLRANVGPRKTAALLAPVGAGSKDVRRQVFSINGGRLPIIRENGPGVWLHAVSHYKHLGSRLAFDGSMAAEVRSKLQAARACFHEGKRDVFCSPRIELSRRVSLFRTHVLTSLFAGSGGWPCLCKRGWVTLEAGFYRMLRQMLRIPRHEDQKWTYERILAAVGLPSLEGFLALERLRFAAQLVRGGPDAVFALIQQAPGFLRAIGLAEQWLLEATAATGSPGTFAQCWPAWCELMGCTGRWNGLLKRAEGWHVQRICALSAYQDMLRVVWQRMPEPVVDSSQAQHACLMCRVAFNDCHAWSAHACATLFCTNIQYRRHLQVSSICCQALEKEFPGLFAVVEEQHGHEQGPSIEGVGTAHLPPLADAVSTPLLRTLQAGQWTEAEQIFEAVTSVIEPLTVLRSRSVVHGSLQGAKGKGGHFF
ncbi:unnamed protein product [Symbiodinium sp. CCMP2592]|nr:unnamed protein product [Symbiodinium sp. CCMP2592]